MEAFRAQRELLSFSVNDIVVLRYVTFPLFHSVDLNLIIIIRRDDDEYEKREKTQHGKDNDNENVSWNSREIIVISFYDYYTFFSLL